MRDAPQEILKIKDHYKIFKRTVPSWKSILFLVSTREMSSNNPSIACTDGFDWSLLGRESRVEIKMTENSMLYYQLKTNA